MTNKLVGGNSISKVIIVALIIFLIITIWYPSKVWKNEQKMADICHHRMEAIQFAELQFLPLNNYVYTDSLQKAMIGIQNNPFTIAALDSQIFWDGLLNKKAILTMVQEKQFPQDLRTLIQTTLDSGLPLRNLAYWDSLIYKIVDALENRIEMPADESIAAIDTSVAWVSLLGEYVFRNILESDTLSKRIKRQTKDEIFQEGLSVQKTKGWPYLWPIFYDSLKSLIYTAQLTGIYEEDEKETWEEQTKSEFMNNLDALPQQMQDSLWIENQRAMYESIEDLLWKEDKNKLWKNEQTAWIDSNETTWTRVIKQDWSVEKKKSWIEVELANRLEKAIDDFETNKESFWQSRIDSAWIGDKDSLAQAKENWFVSLRQYLPDSVGVQFKAVRDSTWRSMIDSLWDLNIDKHYKDKSKDIEAIRKNLWEQERRTSWKETRFVEWIKNKEKDHKALWEEIKETMWKDSKQDIWSLEQKKRNIKNNAVNRLDETIVWKQALNSDKIDNIVTGLSLPNKKTILSLVKKNQEGSALYTLGLIGLLRDDLLEVIATCPESKTLYLLETIQDRAIPKFAIYCPLRMVGDDKISAGIIPAFTYDSLSVDSLSVVDSTVVVDEEPSFSSSAKKKLIAVLVDPTSKDTTFEAVGVPALSKIFGGAKLKSHGIIDPDGKKSWLKKEQ